MIPTITHLLVRSTDILWGTYWHYLSVPKLPLYTFRRIYFHVIYVQ